MAKIPHSFMYRKDFCVFKIDKKPHEEIIFIFIQKCL